MDDKLRERLEKILHLRDNAGTEGEASAAAAQATKILFNHRLSESEFRKTMSNVSQQRTEVVTCRKFDYGDERWIVSLATSVAQSMFCLVFFSQRDQKMTVVGRPTDIDATEQLTAWLVVQCAQIGVDATVKKGKIYTDNYFLGLAGRIGERLTQELNNQQEAVVGGGGYALVRNAKAENEAYVRDVLGLTLGRGRSGVRGDGRGLSDGRRDGGRVNLHASNPLGQGVKALR